MSRSFATAFALLAVMAVSPGLAQPADFPIVAADGSAFPAGVRVKKAGELSVYTDAHGDVLYGMDMRTVLRWAPDPAKFCGDACKHDWKPLLAPASAPVNIRYPAGFDKAAADDTFVDPRKAPDWTVIQGVDGPQWVYKGWHLVFTRRDGNRASTALDGSDDRTWNTLKYIPAVPKIAAPAAVSTAFVAGAYAFTDRDGRVLFTGKCGDGCQWQPLAAPMASSGLGDWRVGLNGDEPEWTLKGRRVFVADGAEPQAVPPEGKILRP
ncbi:hypothetical protein WBP06_22455 [Novosphingobium sp. BL-8H]|uniref:hypothetical protein n=1 Tax=Novosphingobium sp. BL-8H TaxID=3127640 RepID=UPI003757C44A